MPDGSVQRVLVESMLCSHRFRETIEGVWVRGHRFGRRFVARIDSGTGLINLTGRRETRKVPFDADVKDIEAELRAVLDA